MRDLTTRVSSKLGRNSTNPHWAGIYAVQRDAGFGSNSMILGTNVVTKTINKISMKEACRVILLAKTRSGKTFLTRRAIDYVYHTGEYSIAILPDAKDEIKSSLHKVQEEFRAKMRPDEKPHQLPLRIFRPVFFNSIDRNELPEDNEHCAIELTDLTHPDFNDLFGYKDMTPAQQVVADTIWGMLEQKKIKTIEQILQYTIDLPKIKIHDRFMNVYNQNIFNSQYAIDPVDIIRGGEIPVLNYDRYTKLNTSSNGILQVFLSIWLRKLISARQNNDIKPLWIFMDETARWCPSGSNPTCKNIILESVDVDTGYNINYWFATQREESIPTDLIRQCKYVLISSTTDKQLLDFGLRTVNIIRNMNVDGRKFTYIFNLLKANEYSWININTNSTQWDVMVPFAPMSNHMKTRD